MKIGHHAIIIAGPGACPVQHLLVLEMVVPEVLGKDISSLDVIVVLPG